MEEQAVFRMLAGAAQLIRSKTGAEPFRDLTTFSALRAAWMKILDEGLRTAPPEPSSRLREQLADARQATADIPESPELPTRPTIKVLGLLADDEDQTKAVAEMEVALNAYSAEMSEYDRIVKLREKAFSRSNLALTELNEMIRLGESVAAGILEGDEE
ncbi:MAG: hypothetical protein O3C65_10395 [Proteobacteria bacterium]|nr:hypothetical protein [Pseudomonadota bacterium]